MNNVGFDRNTDMLLAKAKADHGHALQGHALQSRSQNVVLDSIASVFGEAGNLKRANGAFNSQTELPF